MNTKATPKIYLRKYIVLYVTLFFCCFSQWTVAQDNCGFGDPFCYISIDTMTIQGCSPADAPQELYTEIEDVFDNLPPNPCGELAMINLPPYVVPVGNGCIFDPYKVAHVYCLFDDLPGPSGEDPDGIWQEHEEAIFGFQFFKIVDVTDPILECPPTIETACTIPDPYPDLAAFIADGGVGSDNCGMIESSFQLQSQTSDGGTCPETITRVYYVQDSCFNAMTCTQLIVINDEDAPTIADLPGSLDEDVLLEDPAGSCFDDLFGTITVSYDPPSNLMLVDLMNGEQWSFPGPTVSDNCSFFVNEVALENLSINTCDAVLTMLWDFRDACDNMSTFQQQITVIDAAAPVIVTAAQDVNATCDGSGNVAELNSWLNNNGGAFATDNCQLTWSNNFTGLSNGCGATGSATVTFTADDGCGHTASTTATFSISDTDAPVIVCPPSQTLTCFETIPPAATSIAEFVALGGLVSESCSTDGNLSIFKTQTDNNGSNCPGDARVHTRTYFVTDECGNQSSCTQTFTYLESFDGPQITDILPACYKYCGDLANPEITDISYTTDCSFGATVDITGPEVIGAENCPGTIYRYSYTVTDDCGRTSFPVTRDFIIGNDGPTIECAPFNLILECGNPNNQDYIDTHLGLVTANSSCGMEVSITYSPQNFNLVSCEAGTVVTFVATDACGRTATCTTTIAILDDTAPTITNIPPSICDVTECGGDANYWFDHWIEYMLNGLEATDDCSAVSWSTLSANPVLNSDCNANGDAETVVTFVATDACNNTATVNGTFVVENEHPAAFANVPGDEVISCLENANFGPDPDILNPCQTTLTFMDVTNNSNPCAVTMTRTWIATDQCGGLTTSASQTITIIDDESPTFSFVPADENIACDSSPVFGTPTAIDECTSASITFEDGSTGDGCSGTYTRIWTATDDCGNVTTASQTLSYTDNESPIFTSVPADGTIDCASAPSFGNPLYSDNCNIVSLSENDTQSGTNCSGSYTRTWTATDACGNSATASQTFTYSDEESPVFTFVPEDETIACDATPNFGTPHTSDNCNTVVISSSTEETGNACSGSSTRTWTATDVCGNTATASQTISYSDTEAPVISNVPNDSNLQCGEDVTLPNPTGTDNCGGVSFSHNDVASGGNCSGGTIVRTWTATDDCGNTATASATVFLFDGTPPVASDIPGPITISCEVDLNSAFGPEPTFADNCDLDVFVSATDFPTPGNCASELVVERVWTGIDDCGNSATASQVITIIDETDPEFTFVPSSTTISCGTIPSFDPAEAADNCSGAIISFDDETAGSGCNTTITRTWIATDACGNSTTATTVITLSDDEAPIFTFVPSNGIESCGDDPNFAEAEADDNCGSVSINHEDEESGSGCNISVTRTWTATDDCGNTATASATIMLSDNESPIFTFVPSDGTESCGDDPNFAEAEADDNCGSVSINHEDEESGSGCNISVTRTWTATDDCGNTATASATITLSDNESPIFTFVPADSIGYCGDDPDFAEPIATDNCGSVSIIREDNESGTGCNFSLTRIWTATDACGNSTTASATLSLIDDDAPYFTFVPAILDVDCDENQDFLEPEAADDCGNVSLTFEDLGVNGTLCNDGFAKSRLWTATDDCGNTATVETTVWVNPDNQGPIWTYVPDVLDVDCDEDQSFEFPEATDNCGSVIITWEEEVNGTLCDAGFAKVRTWTATDDCGNTSTVETTVWVNPDETAPVFTGSLPGGLLDCSEYPPVPNEPDVADACGSVSLSMEEVFYGNPDGCQTGEDFEYHRIWTATDDCGNSSITSQVFIVSGGTTAATANISGAIQTAALEMVSGVTVSLEGAAIGVEQTQTTETIEDGLYQFSNLPLTQNYTVTPHLNADPLNGISSFDLVLMTKHILDFAKLDSPYKLIAADINQSGSLTTADVLSLRRLILHKDTMFQENTSWRFVVADHIFQDALNPFGATFPESSYINGLLANEVQDYVAIKTGDVNGSANPNGLLDVDGRDFKGELSFVVQDEMLEAGETYDIVFKTSDFVEVAGFQYSLAFDPEMVTIAEVIPGNIAGMDSGNFGFRYLEQGFITTSWHLGQTLSLMDDSPLFTIQLTAKQTVSVKDIFKISSQFTSAEAYKKGSDTGDFELHKVQLYFGEAAEIASRYVLYQNEPNPFHDKTSIGFQLPIDTEASITIYDVTGRVLHRINGTYSKGFHQLTIEREKLNAAGVLYYQLVTPKWRSTKKMTLMNW